MPLIPVAALDGSLRNFGVALLQFDLLTGALTVDGLHLLSTENSKVKSVRASSDNFARASSIYSRLDELFLTHKPLFTFVEVPSGGQSYSAVLGFGITIGLYASLSVRSKMIEVAPAETKIAAVGNKNATKLEIIDWAVEKYPAAPWMMRTLKGKRYAAQSNEHLADAVAIAHAGIQTPLFSQAIVAARALIA